MKLLITSILILLTFVAIQNADSQWVQINAPTGGKIKHFALNSAGLFAATETGGVFLRNNGFTQTWAPVNNGLADQHIHALAADGGDLYAGTDSGVCRSTDNGKNWTAVSSQYNILPVNTLAVSGSTVLAGLDKDIYYSADKGSTWIHIHGKGLPNMSVQSIAIDGSRFYAAFAGRGVFSSTDNGANWIANNSGLTDSNIVILSSRGSNVFVSTALGVFHSSDNGANWVSANNGISESAIVNSFVLTDTVSYVCTDCCIYRTMDSGKNWRALSTIYFSYVFSFSLSGQDLFASTDQGIYRSSNNGVTWTLDGLTDEIIGNILAASETTLFLGTRSGVFSSPDQGKSWDQLGLKFETINCILINGNAIIAGTEGGIYVSIDNGKSWVLENTTDNIFSIILKGTNIFAAGYYHGVFRSSDNGSTWITSNNGIVINGVNSIITDGTDLYLGSDNGIYASSNDGSNWGGSTIESQIGATRLYSSLMSGNDFLVGSNAGVLSSMDSGKTWVKVNNGLTDLNVVSLAISDSHIFAATRGGVFHSTNNGQSWAGINNGLTNTYMMSLVISGQFLYACVGSNFGSSTSGGVFRRPLSDFVINAVKSASNSPQNFFSVYPNPAENVLSIESLNSPGIVNCTLFDQLGRPIFMHENIDFSKESKVAIDVSNVPSGMYFLRIKSNAISYTKAVFIRKG